MATRPIVSTMDAESYFASVLRTTEWDAAEASKKEQALSQASFLISGAFVFNDSAYSTDSDGTTVWNERVVAAVCEEALWLLSHDPSDIPSALFNGISSASAGSVSATFDKSFICPWIYPLARILIGDLAVYVGDDSGATVRTTLLAM